jgi:hypothetical protein
MGIAKVKLGMLKHFNQILDTWGGKKVTHIIITETIDELGQIINQSRVETIIYGIVGDASFKGNNFPLGLLQPGDLCLMAKYSDNIIIDDSTDHEPVFCKYLLRRVTI